MGGSRLQRLCCRRLCSLWCAANIEVDTYTNGNRSDEGGNDVAVHGEGDDEECVLGRQNTDEHTSTSTGQRFTKWLEGGGMESQSYQRESPF